MPESESIFVPGNETLIQNQTAPAQPVAQTSYDALLNTGITVVVVIFLLWWLAGKVGLTGSPRLHIFTQRKQALREIKTGYIHYVKNHGSRTNQRLYYGAVQIGKIRRLARLPYRIKLTYSAEDPKTRKTIFKKEKKTTSGAFIIFEIQRHSVIGKLTSRWNDFYLVEEKLIPEKSNDAIQVSQEVSFDVYFGIWISKGKISVAQIDDAMWKYQNELLLSALPGWAESIANVSPKTANEGATMEKEAEIKEKEKGRYVKNF